MEIGGTTAFYGLAATLIPVLFVGSILVENLRPPRQTKMFAGQNIAGLSREEVDVLVDRTYPWPPVRRVVKFFLWTIYPYLYPPWIYYVCVLLPVLAAWVVFAEIVAIAALVREASDSFDAWVVGGTLLLGALVALLLLWVPWLRELGARLKARSKWAVAWVLAPVVIAACCFVVLGVFSAPYLSRIFDSHTHPPRERVWLEHLIATSDFRIAKLNAEAHTSEAVKQRTAPHQRVQRKVEQQECRELSALLADERLTDSVALPSPCSLANTKRSGP